MNTLVIVLIAAVCLFGAYVLYGRWLANKWGIDPAAKTLFHPRSGSLKEGDAEDHVLFLAFAE